MELNKVYIGDNIDILKTFPNNSIDSVVTDPPYGLGKEPNAVALLTDWVTHGYHEIKGKGFMGNKWDAFVPQPIFWKEVYRVLKPGGYVLSFAGTRTYDWMVMAIRLAGFEVRDMIAWLYGSGFPKSMDVSKAIDKHLGVEREVVGKTKGAVTSGEVMKTGLKDEYNITKPSTKQSKQWQGWGTALKPALEPIVMARKPLDGTVAQNVLKHGVGGINLDDCRIGTDVMHQDAVTRKSNGIYGDIKVDEKTSIGRFPANVTHDGSDEVVDLFPNVGNENNGVPYDYSGKSYDNKKTSMFNGDKPMSPSNYNDMGSAARFFYTAKASQSERNFGLGAFETVKSIVYGEGMFKDRNTQKKNIHPTVKPIDLMQYLVRLVTPMGGVCLDPFLGSGTTAVACKAEKFDYIGIEQNPEYASIAQARIDAEVVKYDIFDFMEE